MPFPVWMTLFRATLDAAPGAGVARFTLPRVIPG
jgi:hypothetical protein